MCFCLLILTTPNPHTQPLHKTALAAGTGLNTEKGTYFLFLKIYYPTICFLFSGMVT
ncbi:hypothetical protein HanPSC8_Chr10g0407731 [Helianthus annuus]|nr:hypothetical protein HanPSC8_Chr10g0407731 [Helianthus annuus]